MPFGSPPLTALISWCRALRHGLDVGLSPVRVFRQQARSGPTSLRPVADRLADRLETGESFADALKPDAGMFPYLFIELVAVGEQSGRLPAVFEDLEHYFETLRAARKDFIRMMIWPAIQYFGAIFVLTLMLFILGMFGSSLDPLGLGLTGVGGAVTFFVAAMTFTAAVAGTAYVVSANKELRAKAEAKLLPVPGLGGCFRAFALHRFCMAFHMTTEAGLRADRCLRLSLRATANQAYAAEAAPIAKSARRGEEIASVFAGYRGRLFPDEFVDAVTVGEESGRLGEVMKKQAEFYREEAGRKFKLLARIAGGAVYVMVAVLLIVIIMKMAMTYTGELDKAQRAADDPQGWLRGR